MRMLMLKFTLQGYAHVVGGKRVIYVCIYLEGSIVLFAER